MQIAAINAKLESILKNQDEQEKRLDKLKKDVNEQERKVAEIMSEVKGLNAFRDAVFGRIAKPRL